MEKQDIINGSKLIAEYLGWVYITFNDLQGYSRPGWWKVARNVWGDDGLGRYMLSKTKNHKDKLGSSYYVCRNHYELRFYNSFDAIIPVIEKIEEKDKNVKVHLNNGGCEISVNRIWQYNSFKSDLTWIQNTFNAVVKYLEENGRN